MNQGKTTAPADVMPPQRFRAQCTGIGQTIAASEATGAARAAEVVMCMPAAAKRAVAPAQGYPGR